MSETIQPGWHPDPLGRHEHRYFDGSEWTEHIADSTPPAPTPPPAVSGTPIAVPGTAALVTLPDSDEQRAKRKKFGVLLIAAAVALVMSVAAPWITGPGDDAVTLAGYQLGAGALAGGTAVVLGLYGWQGLAKPRVRYHVAVLVMLVIAFPSIFFCKAFLTDEEVAELNGSVEVGQSVTDLLPVDVEIRSSSPERVKAESTTEFGLTIALAAMLAATVPFGVLWKDDRERRRRAGLLL